MDFKKEIISNYASLVLGYLSLPFLIALIHFSIKRINYKDAPHKNFEGDPYRVCCAKTIVMMSFLMLFLGFYSYITYNFSKNIFDIEKVFWEGIIISVEYIWVNEGSSQIHNNGEGELSIVRRKFCELSKNFNNLISVGKYWTKVLEFVVKL